MHSRQAAGSRSHGGPRRRQCLRSKTRWSRRAVYNAMYDRRPHAVVQCTDSADVMAVIAAARDSGVDLAIRGGGHGVPGFGTVDDGLVIDRRR